jgi:TonB family protein
MQEGQMIEAATKRMGQVVDGKFRLGQRVGGNQRSTVFLVDYDGQEVPKAAIKLIPADSVDAAGQLARWRQAAKLSHPHLIRLLDMGRCEIDDTAMLYVVMEFAEENLAQVVARRPLNPSEVRDILGPVVDALAYVHAKGFVHCRLKPANIMADNDLLKISSDGLCRIGESGGSQGKSGAYDPPEASGGRISPAGDVWSLGMTLAEVLTQRLPVWERTNQAEPALPTNLPPDFLDLARHCLRRDPQLRWTVSDIAARLQQNSPAPPRPITPDPENSFVNPRAVGAAVLAGVGLVAILGGLLVFRTQLRNRPTAPLVVEQPAAHANAPLKAQLPVHSNAPAKEQPKPENKSALAAKSPTPIQVPPRQPAPVAKPAPQPAAKPALPPPVAKSLEKPSGKKPVAGNPAPSPTPVPSQPSPAGSANGIVHGKVVQQILPDAPQKARNTIRGKVRVSVRVRVDESGRVTQATFDSPGPSQYFADRVLQAAQLWKFAPAKTDGRNVPSEWLLRFEIDPAAINVSSTEKAP